MNAINELRKRLKAENIPYENNDDNSSIGFIMERIKVPSIKNCKISIIQGDFSYGAKDDLLEMWDYREDEPCGYLTVDEVLDYVKENM